jgi:nicotinate-nucleotide adenylyltransferase
MWEDQLKRSHKIGIFGGSFDPVHTGHLIIAEMAMDYVGLDVVLFIPTASPPHKEKGDLSDFKIRLKMLELALEENDRFEISTLERKEQTSYTYETVMHFRQKGMGKNNIHLLVGSDSLDDMPNWKNPGYIYSNATIVVMVRPGYENFPPLSKDAAVIALTAGSNSISSSEIRERVSEGRSIRYLVPRPVESYIVKKSLYK